MPFVARCKKIKKRGAKKDESKKGRGWVGGDGPQGNAGKKGAGGKVVWGGLMTLWVSLTPAGKAANRANAKIRGSSRVKTP